MLNSVMATVLKYDELRTPSGGKVKLTKCPNGKLINGGTLPVRIGSKVCRQCSSFQGASIISREVYCNFNIPKGKNNGR